MRDRELYDSPQFLKPRSLNFSGCRKLPHPDNFSLCKSDPKVLTKMIICFANTEDALAQFDDRLSRLHLLRLPKK